MLIWLAPVAWLAIACQVRGSTAPLGRAASYVEFNNNGGSPANSADQNSAALARLLTAGGALKSGGRLVLGSGTYRFSQMGRLTGLIVEGASEYATILEDSSSSGTLAVFGDSTVFRDLTISASAQKTGGDSIVFDGNRDMLENVTVTRYFRGVRVGDSASDRPVVDPQLVNVSFRSPSIGANSGAIDLEQFSNAVVERLIVTGTAFGGQPDYGLRIGSGDTALITQTNITRHGRALDVDTPAGKGLFAINITASLFDSAGIISGNEAAPSADIRPQGGVFNMQLVGDWFGLSTRAEGLRIFPSRSGEINGLEVTAPDVMGNGGDGILVGGKVSNLTINGGQFAGMAHGAAVNVGAGVSNCIVTQTRIGDIARRGPNRVGIELAPGLTSGNIWLHDNLVSSSTSANIVAGTPAMADLANGNRIF